MIGPCAMCTFSRNLGTLRSHGIGTSEGERTDQRYRYSQRQLWMRHGGRPFCERDACLLRA